MSECGGGSGCMAAATGDGGGWGAPLLTMTWSREKRVTNMSKLAWACSSLVICRTEREQVHIGENNSLTWLDSGKQWAGAYE
jgi:hypothetical protein